MKTSMRLGILTVGTAAAIGFGGGTALAADPKPNEHAAHPAAAQNPTPVPMWDGLKDKTVEDILKEVPALKEKVKELDAPGIQKKKASELAPPVQEKVKAVLTELEMAVPPMPLMPVPDAGTPPPATDAGEPPAPPVAEPPAAEEPAQAETAAK